VTQIRELMQDKQIDEDLNETERNALLSFKRMCRDFLGNHKSSVLSGCCAGPVDFAQSYGMQFESENPLPGVKLGFSPRKSWQTQRQSWQNISPTHYDY